MILGNYIQLEEEGKRRTVPDWEKALGNIEALMQKLFGFLAPGSHYGKPINREDAELAIMSTHALINFVAKKLVDKQVN